MVMISPGKSWPPVYYSHDMDLKNFINGCKAVEEEVASIYRTFADFFPQYRSFWEDLYRDELEHSFWLSDADHYEAIDLLPSEDLMPSMDIIEQTLAYARTKSRHIKTNPVTFEEALRIALKMEESMVETFTNEMAANLFASDYESLSQKIIAAEKLHIRKIEDMMIGKGFLQLS
jgi:rubrerythrin